MHRLRITILTAALLLLGTAGFGPGPAGEGRAARASDELDLLKSLPYTTWSAQPADPQLSGITRHDPHKAYQGYNLYTDDRTQALLMDMAGNIVHRWTFPGIPGKWEYAVLLSGGEIVALCVGKVLARLKKDSTVVWVRPIRPHHDIAVLGDGTFLVPFYPGLVEYRSLQVSFDAIAHVSADGRMMKAWHSYRHLKALQQLHPPTELDKTGGQAMLEAQQWYEYYHLNTVESLPPTPLAAKDVRFTAGNILTCLRNASLICIIDRHTGLVVWSYGPGELDWPHMPTMLANGNILIYDNGVHRDYSRIVELDPLEKKIVWEYKAATPQDFYSKWRGSSQRLPGGNTFICESENGRAFEVTPAGEIVWEFYNPELKAGKRQLIYRMIRVAPDKVNGWLDLEREK